MHNDHGAGHDRLPHDRLGNQRQLVLNSDQRMHFQWGAKTTVHNQWHYKESDLSFWQCLVVLEDRDLGASPRDPKLFFLCGLKCKWPARQLEHCETRFLKARSWLQCSKFDGRCLKYKLLQRKSTKRKTFLRRNWEYPIYTRRRQSANDLSLQQLS